MSDQGDRPAQSSPESVGQQVAARVGPFWSREKVQAELDLPSGAVLEDLQRRGAVLGLRTADARWIFPVWQFRPRGDGSGVEVRPALRVAMEVMRDINPWGVAALLTIPAPELGGRTPSQVARDEPESEELINFAARVAAEWRD